ELTFAPNADSVTKITAIWGKALGRDLIEAHDNVFKIGAHSLHVARVHAQLREHFQKKITIAQLFQFSKPQALAAYFEESTSDRTVKRTKSRQTTGSRDIGVIGMAGRFPGAPDLHAYWENLRQGIESIRDFTEEELEAAGIGPEIYRDERYVKRGSAFPRHGHFDAGFFEMSPMEAEHTNPHHRLFLQAAWETLEHAGYVPSTYDGFIGLYAGGGHNSYAQRFDSSIPGVHYLQLLVGNEHDYMATRTEFKLGLRGTAMSIQTACSTSLVAVQVACEALLSGPCDIALAGGVSVAWPEGQGYLYEEGMIFSKDGHCRAFEAKASGTIFSPGVGLVALKPLEQTIEDGDTVHAVIRGIAINNDGNSKGSFASPSIEGQAEVISDALGQQDIDPSTISYVEADGTGTIIGDPIEVAGLTQAYRQHTSNNQYCALGSVKPNIGHTDAAAGIAGLLKLILSLKHRQIPPTLNYDTPNPERDLKNSPFYIQNRLTGWDSVSPRRGAVSSFGLGGTNAHAIVEEAPEQAPSSLSRPFQLLPFSASSKQALEDLVARWPAFLAANPTLSLPDAAYTLQTGRTAFDHRGFVVADSLEGHHVIFDKTPIKQRRTAFLFTGQGAHYTDQGEKELQSECQSRDGRGQTRQAAGNEKPSA
ncbi:MAG: beta-ketoacyl synthase N-terminal-like domain-containing protein, partial [Verrucomicrobiales bacterium]